MKKLEMRSMRLPAWVCVVFALLGFMSTPVVAADKAILTLIHTSQGERVQKHYSYDDLLAFEQQVFTTNTPWTAGPNQYQGPKLTDVLEDAGMLGQKDLLMTALNRYTAELTPHFTNLAVLVIQQDGQPMPVRNKGPVWVLLPLDDMPDEQIQDNYLQMVWQLKSIEAR
ncbi:MAG: hypothetical protein ACPGMR_13875 [Pontibacterium sp.]